MVTMPKKKLTKSWLDDVPAGKVFWCHDGRVLKNLDELLSGLKEMSDETYRYHVAQGNSDFSNWVGDVIGDTRLARDLRKATSRNTAAGRVEDRLHWLHASR